MHIFSYSPRINTKAYKFSTYPDSKDVKQRLNGLKRLADFLAVQYAKKYLNKTIQILVESRRDRATQLLTGYTDTYIKIFLKGSDNLMNQITSAKLINASRKGSYAIPASP